VAFLHPEAVSSLRRDKRQTIKQQSVALSSATRPSLFLQQHTAAVLLVKQDGCFLPAPEYIRYNGLLSIVRSAYAASAIGTGSRCIGSVTRRKGVTDMSVELRPGESQDSLLKRFRKAVAEARILPIVRQKRWFTSKSEIRRIKAQKSIRKSQRPPREK
jgi:small subunit ribosomal protein S21